MAMDMNVVCLVGRLTRDPELRHTKTGTCILKFSLAVNRRKKNGDNWEDEVSFINVVLMGKQAQGIAQYMAKGKQVAVNGELQENRWEENGNKRSRIEVIARSVQLLASNSQPQQSHSTVPDDDIPF